MEPTTIRRAHSHNIKHTFLLTLGAVLPVLVTLMNKPVSLWMATAAVFVSVLCLGGVLLRLLMADLQDEMADLRVRQRLAQEKLIAVYKECDIAQRAYIAHLEAGRKS